MLYSRYHNNVFKLKKQGLIKTNEPSNPVSSKPLSPPHSDLNFSSIELWLKINEEPWTTIEDNWKKTTKYRKRTFQNLSVLEIINKWPLYKSSKGYLLVLFF